MLVPCSGFALPAGQPWLLWMVYGLFTSHVDIAFHTLVRNTLLSSPLRKCLLVLLVPLLAPLLLLLALVLVALLLHSRAN